MAHARATPWISAFLALMRIANIYHSKSSAETIAYGRSLGRTLKGGTVVALVGDLGSGKTTLVKGIALGLGMQNKREIRSPTFVIFHIYKGRIPLYHFDLYRLDRESDLEAIGIEEFLSEPNVVSVIEWADRIPSVVKRSDVTIKLLSKGEHNRMIQITFRGRSK